MAVELPFFPTNYAEHEAHILKTATKFTACGFKGRAVYETKETKTLAAAKRAARSMIAKRDPTDLNRKRPVLIYAIAGVHQVVAELVHP